MYSFDPDRLAKLEALRAEGQNPYPSMPADAATPASAKALRDEVQAILEAAGVPCAVVEERLALTPGESAEPRKAMAALAERANLALAAAGVGDRWYGGRVMFKNEMGKAGFARVVSRDGRFQVYVRENVVGADFAAWKALDLGDQVLVLGAPMFTRAGELTVGGRGAVDGQTEADRAREQSVARCLLVGKCIKSLPDKWHGIEDPELRRRQRYLDLFVNDASRDTFVKRSRIVRLVRDFFEARGFLEVETPMMHPIPGGATARPFQTHHNALDMELFLRVAPELYLKRLIVGGLERVFEINRSFRNEGIDATHNPEFTMLEFYQAYATWEELADLTEELIAGLVAKVHGGDSLTYQGREVSFRRPFRRAGYDELVAEALGLPREAVHDLATLQAAIGEGAPRTIGKCWERVFDEKVEATLVNPTFVTRFPVEISPLARRNDREPHLADRFELFIAGREFANAFNELNDPVDQAERFLAQARAKDAGDEEAMHFDADYVEALCYGMPPTAGEGIGIDRLVMLLTDTASIRDVILFPTLRSKPG